MSTANKGLLSKVFNEKKGISGNICSGAALAFGALGAVTFAATPVGGLAILGFAAGFAGLSKLFGKTNELRQEKKQQEEAARQKAELKASEQKQNQKTTRRFDIQ
jgi:hypothetical protein